MSDTRRDERSEERSCIDSVVSCNHSWEEVGYWFRCTKCGIWQDETEEYKAENKWRNE